MFLVTITILVGIRRSVSSIRHDLSETGFFLHFQMENSQFDPVRFGERD
jgi:hypothetical protein